MRCGLDQEIGEWASGVDHDFSLDVSALGGKECGGGILLLLLFGLSKPLVFGGVGIVGEGLLAGGGGGWAGCSFDFPVGDGC